MIRIKCCLLVLLLARAGGVAGDLAFGPDHLRLSFEEGWYKVHARFADNTRCKKQIRYVPIQVDRELIKVTEPLFYSPPIRLFQSACQADTAIAVNNGARRFPSQVVFIRNGEISRIVKVPLGQGPGEMMQAGNAMLVKPRVLVVYGMKKAVAFDLSTSRPTPVASTVLKMGAGVSFARMGHYPEGFVLINDTMDRTSAGKIYGFAIYTLKERKFVFMRTGSVAYPQDKILLKRPMIAYDRFLKTGRSNYVSNMLSNRIADGFTPFETVLLDFNNQALLLLSTKENQILQYTTFDPERFVESWFEGDDYFCIPRFDDLAVNHFNRTVWLLNHPKMDKSRHLLPVSQNGHILTENLQEIDVLNGDFTYKETLRLVPPRQYARFYVKAITVTGPEEMTVMVQLATEAELNSGHSGRTVLTRLRFR